MRVSFFSLPSVKALFADKIDFQVHKNKIFLISKDAKINGAARKKGGLREMDHGSHQL